MDDMKSLAEKRTIRDFLPLIVIFSTIVIFTGLMQFYFGGSDLDFGMRMFMGAFFAIYGFFKMINLKAFAEAYPMYDIIAQRWKPYAYLYPFLEIGLAVLYLGNFGGIARDSFTLVLMTVSVIGVIIKLRKKETIPCACLGMVFVLPMTWVTLFEDMLMAVEALFMILMPLGYQLISLEQNNLVLGLHLKIHDSAEWVSNSELGHWVVGAVLMLFLISSFVERRKGVEAAAKNGFVRTAVPILLLIMGLGLSVVDSIVHAMVDDFEAVKSLLLTPYSQWFQHFVGGLLIVVAGIAEWRRMRSADPRKNRFITPVILMLIGIGFFFHQQLGALDSVFYSMNWHMTFGALVVVGSVMRILDLLLFEENKSFFAIWAVTLLIAFGMMSVYREPPGAYEVATPEQEEVFEEALEEAKVKWKLL
ncbi:hypothetical protein JKY72_01455 [Candidatus Gracilibacteria bacterium]|nr:hypothetical protein [Candidatus Gracilibacteria bacterium]